MIQGSDHLEITQEKYHSIRKAANFTGRVNGLTHRFYKYPARFSPAFVSQVIQQFSSVGDLVLDPYMGGGTTLVEAMVLGRRSVGCDINSLAAFVAEVKTTPLFPREFAELCAWAVSVLPNISHRFSTSRDLQEPELGRTRNLHLPRARSIKKYLSLAFESLPYLDSLRSRAFARCVLLNASQWALNGRRSAVTVGEFRTYATNVALEMLEAIAELDAEVKKAGHKRLTPEIIHDTAANVSSATFFAGRKEVDLVVTSPPYPGIHMLYHRWQVDGRKETPAPYWIANCLDGAGSSYYNFGSREQHLHESYFEQSLSTLRSIRAVMRRGAPFVQMIAFSNPKQQLARYLENMQSAGFVEGSVENLSRRRIWRDVPRRSWYAELGGQTSSAREVVLIHYAV